MQKDENYDDTLVNKQKQDENILERHDPIRSN